MITSETKKRVVQQEIGVNSMEDYMAEKLMEIERNKIDSFKVESILKGYKQLNVRHKNIIDAQRLEIKERQLNSELEKIKPNK